MTARSIRILVIAAAFLAGLVALLRRRADRWRAPLLAGRAADRRHRRAFQARRSERAGGQRSGLKGRPFLVFFGFTHCPDVCPTTLFEVSEMFRALGPTPIARARCSSPSTPSATRPRCMKDYLSSFDPHLSGLTGDPAAIAAVAKAYRVYYKKVPLDEGTTPWTTRPSCISWTRRAVSCRPSISSARPKPRLPICADTCDAADRTDSPCQDVAEVNRAATDPP